MTSHSQNDLSGFYFSKHRLEALVDGIFAVAMTLLVIELKFPEGLIKSNADLQHALAHLIPKFIAWIVSFFILAQFWMGNHRLFQYVKHVDHKLTVMMILFLGLASLMPFSAMLVGEYALAFTSQVFYAVILAGLALMSWRIASYVHHTPTITHGMPDSFYRAARLRTLALVFISIVSVIIGFYLPGWGNAAFALMGPIAMFSRRMHRNAQADGATP